MRKVLMLVAIGLGVVVLSGGVASVIIGYVFSSTVTAQLKQEKVSLRIFDDTAPADAIISNADQARKAAETIAEHRRSIAPTYADLLAGKKFDPANPEHLSYAQAMNLENSLNLAALAFGLSTILTFNGVVLTVIGTALIIVGVSVWLFHRGAGARGAGSGRTPQHRR